MKDRIILAVAVCAVALSCASCGSPEEAAVAASFYDFENALNWSDGDTVVTLYTADSFAIYDKLLRHALESDEATVKGLAPFALSEVVTMRNRCERAELEKMDGRAWVKHATEQGWYIYEDDPDRPEYFFEIGKIRVSPDSTSATARVAVDGEQMQSRLEFVHEDGRWKRTLVSDMQVIDEMMHMWVDETGIDMIDLILDWEEWEFGELHEDLWRPMRQRRR